MFTIPTKYCKTLYIDVYMIVSSFRYLTVELDILFQYVYKVAECFKKLAPQTS